MYNDAVPGLALRVTPLGVKTWSLRFRVGGQQMPRLTLGRYPTVRLETARKKAHHELRAVSDGANPAAEKKAARVGDTVHDLAKDYIDKYAKKHKRSWRDDARYLEAEILPAWRSRKVKELTRRDVRILIEGIAERGSPILGEPVPGARAQDAQLRDREGLDRGEPRSPDAETGCGTLARPCADR